MSHSILVLVYNVQHRSFLYVIVAALGVWRVCQEPSGPGIWRFVIAWWKEMLPTLISHWSDLNVYLVGDHIASCMSCTPSKNLTCINMEGSWMCEICNKTFSNMLSKRKHVKTYNVNNVKFILKSSKQNQTCCDVSWVWQSYTKRSDLQNMWWLTKV